MLLPLNPVSARKHRGEFTSFCSTYQLGAKNGHWTSGYHVTPCQPISFNYSVGNGSLAPQVFAFTKDRRISHSNSIKFFFKFVIPTPSDGVFANFLSTFPPLGTLPKHDRRIFEFSSAVEYSGQRHLLPPVRSTSRDRLTFLPARWHWTRGSACRTLNRNRSPYLLIWLAGGF